MKKPVLVLLAALLAIAVVVAGCGGGSDSTESTESTASISKSQFLKEGNAICKEGNEEIGEGFEKFAKANHLSEKNEPTETQSKEAAETILLPAIKKQVDGIRALGTPEGDEGELDELLTSVEGAIEEGEEDPVALIEEEGGNPFAQPNKEAREYGLTVCGSEDEG